MEDLVLKLEHFCLKTFIRRYRNVLCEKTTNQLKIASFLMFDADQSTKIMAPPDNFQRCFNLYELIEKTATASNLIEALENSNNDHVLKFIESVLMDALSFGANPNRSRGIWFNIPERIESFCGREDFLSQLHDQLKPKDDSETEVTVLSQVKIVSGLGGIGKTQTARKYITKQRKFYNNFIWIDAETENSMGNSFLKLAEEIKIPIKNSEGKSREIQEIVQEIYNKISEDGQSNLIVFDNAEDYLSCRQFFPFGLHPDLTKPVILATSRNQEWISPTGKIRVLPLDKMTEDESLEFILKQLEIPESEIPEFKEESKEFIELIGGLPLALQQAVAYIKEERELRGFIGKSYKISDYVKEFKLSMKKFLTFSPDPVQDSSPTVFVTYNLTLLKFFDLDNGEEAIKILAHLSFLYADKIPSTFLHSLVPEIKDGEFSGALKLLNKYSLIKMNVRDFCLSLHRQLQFVILQYLKESNDVSNVVTNITERCTIVLKNINLSKSSDIFLNMHQIVKNQFDLIPVTEEFLDFMYDFGEVLWRASRYSESLEVYIKVYSKSLELLGEDHHNTLGSQHQIALQLFELGRYEEALSLYKQVLEKRENHPDFGVDHPATIKTKHNIAAVLRQQGKYGEALELFQQVLEQENKIHGENHALMLKTQNQIVSVHYEQGDLSKALALLEEIEKKQTEILGPDLTDVLQTKHAKATAFFDMGKFEEAAKIFHEVHEKWKENLGENHSLTINSVEWIGRTLEQEEKLEEALEIYKKVYNTRKTNLGEDHAKTFKTQHHIALQLLKLGKFDEGMTLHQEILEKQQLHLGVDHPSTTITKHNMADALRKQGKYGEALELFQQVLAQRNKIFGENHPETLTTQSQIALVHSKLENFSQSLSLYKTLEKKQIEILEPDHPDFINTKHNKACVLFEMGEFHEASKLFNEVYEKYKEILGETRLQTITTLCWIGRILEQQGNFTQALNTYKKVYEIRKTQLGQDHPNTVDVKTEMINVESKIKSLSKGQGE